MAAHSGSVGWALAPHAGDSARRGHPGVGVFVGVDAFADVDAGLGGSAGSE